MRTKTIAMPAPVLGLEMPSLLCGDCLLGMDAISEPFVDLAICDPPFNINFSYDVYRDNKPVNEYLDWSAAWMRKVYRLLKPQGSFWLAIGDELAAEMRVLAKAVGFVPRSWVVWHYTFGVNCKNNFSRSHTHLMYFVKDHKSFTFNAENPENRIPSARMAYGDKRADPKGRLPDNTWIFRPQDLPEEAMLNQDTWQESRVCGTFKERAGFHGCQMPVRILERIISCCSNPGDVIFDPMAGSGTSLVAAQNLGRRAFGYELSPDYVEQAKKRLDANKIRLQEQKSA